MRHQEAVVPELLLPLSFAMSRPLLAVTIDAPSSAGAVLAATFVCAIILRHLDKILRGLLVPPAVSAPDVLVRALCFLLQLMGSTCWWVAAELAVGLGNADVPSLFCSATRQTVFGVLGVAGTALAFILPLVQYAWHEQQRASSSSVLTPEGATQLSDREESTADDGAETPGETGKAQMMRRVQLVETPLSSAASSSPSGAPSRSATSGAGTGVSSASSTGAFAEVQPEQRRELFGFRRRLRSFAENIANVVMGDETDEDGHQRGRTLDREGSGIHLSNRGMSIVANTEVMTQMALAAKNDELERISMQKAVVVEGLADVLALVSAATRQHPLPNGEDDDQSRGTAGHRALLSACFQAQALLQSLLEEHGQQESSHWSASETTRLGGSRCNVGELTGGADTPGLAPNGTAASMGAAAADGVTWTGAFQVHDVDARLYRER